MEQETDKIADDYKAWLKREEHLRGLFPKTLEKNSAYIREKLRFYEGLRIPPVGRLNDNERMTLAVLRQERKTFVKQVYPNFFIRLARNVIKAAGRQIKRSKEVKNQFDPAAELKDQLRKSGFSRLIGKLENNVELGMKSFRLSDAHYVSEREMMDYQLMVKKQPEGDYVLEGYKATLTDGQNEKKSHYFQPEDSNLISADQAHRLLSGGAILVTETVDHVKEVKWIQLDLSDKGLNDQYRIKEFQASYGFDVEKVINGLPFIQKKYPGEIRDIISGMEQGKRMEVSFEVDDIKRTVFLSANPQMKTIDVFDADGKKYSDIKKVGAEVEKKTNLQQSQEKQNQKNQVRTRRNNQSRGLKR